MDCFGVLVTQFEWLVNVTQADVIWTAVTDMYTSHFYAVMVCLTILTLMMPFVLTLCVLLLHLLLSFLVYIYCRFNCLQDKSAEDKAFDKIAYVTCLFWYYYGRLCHGYEIKGMDSIPSKGSAVIVYYHGPIPLDYWFIGSNLYLFRNRIIRPVVDRFLDTVPGISLALRLMKVVSGPAETCTKVLNDGHLLFVAPGGMYEGLFGGYNYELLWRNRLGYAKVAIEAKSPIIPVFTVNIREAFRATGFFLSWFEKLYLKTRHLVVPVYGGGPVKLKTIVGQPIAFDPALTAEELNRKVMMSMEQLIKENQRLPGSISMALLDRIYCREKLKVV